MYIENELSNLERNISLSQYTSFRIGGKAKYFFKARTEKEIIRAIRAAKKLKLPFFVFGGGSNILVSDKGFDGLVIKIQNTKYNIRNTKITAGAGTPLSVLVNKAFKKNLSGLEWAAGIPGTLGGAIQGNAGAFGESIADIIKKVKVLDVKSMRIKNYDPKDCKFSYRQSIFKKKRNLVIISAELKLKKDNREKIEKRIEEFLNYKKTTQPLNFLSAGSVFVNPKDFYAAELIEKAGLKGKKAGGAEISEKHANFIVNSGGGRAKDVIKLVKLIKKEVKNKFKIALEEEIQYLGF